MSMRINIENILKSNKSVFEEILNKLQAETVSNAKEELHHIHTFDQILFDAIDLTLKLLQQEENFISRLLYRSFGLGKNRNKRREQLIILGSELKFQFSKEKEHQKNIYQLKENLNSSLKNLKRLRKALKDKITFIASTLLQDRCYSYMQEIDKKIKEILKLQKELNHTGLNLEKDLKVYERQLKKIPRYHELQEERYLELLEDPKYK